MSSTDCQASGQLVRDNLSAPRAMAQLEPAIEVTDIKDAVVVKMQVPGAKKEDIHLTPGCGTRPQPVVQGSSRSLFFQWEPWGVDATDSVSGRHPSNVTDCQA